MLQLRNRYHIEKRRIETLQAESPRRTIESKWPLFEQLSFLNDHIPVRRSFRNMSCKRTTGEIAIKSEQGTDVESDSEPRDDGGSDYLPGTRKGSIQVRNYATLIAAKVEKPLQSSTPYHRAPPRLTRMQRQVQVPRPVQVMHQRMTTAPEQGPSNGLPYGANKFLAFGRFLTSSLIELPENEALLLVNQFTSELVNSYLKKSDTNPLRPSNDRSDVFMESNGHGDNLQE